MTTIQPVIRDAARKNFLDALADLGSVALACKAAGVPRSTVYDWRQEDEAFRLEWERALDAAAALLEHEALRRAVEGVERPVYQGGVKVGTVREYSDRLLEVLLRGARPDRYGTKRVEHAGGIVVQVVTGVPPERHRGIPDAIGHDNARTREIEDHEDLA